MADDPAPAPMALDGQGDDDPPRGMERFTALSAQAHPGFPADSGAAKTLAALRARP